MTPRKIGFWNRNFEIFYRAEILKEPHGAIASTYSITRERVVKIVADGRKDPKIAKSVQLRVRNEQQKFEREFK